MNRTESLQRIVDMYDLREVSKTLGIKQASGNSFHCFNTDAHTNGDKHPSLAIYKDHFKCFGCGVHGDIFTLLEEVKGLSFKEALSLLDPNPSTNINTKKRPAAKKPMPQITIRQTLPSVYLECMSELWSILKPTTLSNEAASWLRSRALLPKIAYDYGCREFSSSKKAIKTLLKSYAPEAAGFANPETPQKLWLPLKRLDRHEMLAIPCWSPEYPFPIQWRCRLYSPWKKENRTLKVLAQHRLIGCVQPLGLRTIPSDKHVLICEGETDFLSFQQITEDMEDIAIIGICAISQGWKEAWTPYITSAKNVFIAVHDNQSGKTFAAQVARHVAQRIGIDHARSSIFRMLLSEKRDANDLLKANELTSWLKSL